MKSNGDGFAKTGVQSPSTFQFHTQTNPFDMLSFGQRLRAPLHESR